MVKPSLDSLKHYGIARKSGRYPWGSGEDPYQSESSFLGHYEELKSSGLSEVEIASKLGMNTSELRNNITWARRDQRNFFQSEAKRMQAEGATIAEISKSLNVSPRSVSNYLKDAKKPHAQLQWEGITEALTEGVANTGYLDVGVGVERQIDVSRNKLNSVVSELVEKEGYYIHNVSIKRLSDPSKRTTVKVLTKEPDLSVVVKNSDKIRPLTSWSEDGGQTINNIKPPQMLDRDRVHVRYVEDGGAEKDGLIELRRGVEDLDLGNSKYAQVRVGVGDNLYMKGMAAYSDDKDFPSGKDVIYNVTKGKGSPDDRVFKVMKDDTDNPFGANINKQSGALNIVNEEGDWDTWSSTVSSQFLSKQPVSLVKDRLDATYEQLRTDFEEIVSLTNPVVKKHLLESYSDGLDAKAKDLKAQGLARTMNHVLLPVKELRPNEVYAPNYNNGERVALVRHPHGGVFEIPDLVVNNNNPAARKILGTDSTDAIAIHPSVAGKLSGADFDGDTVLVIPNNRGQVKTARSLKELHNFDPMMYQVDRPTIDDTMKQRQMGMVSNLITDMTIKGASHSEIANAVKHSMVVIDSEKHRLDYKQSAIDNRISALTKKWQGHVSPDTGKESRAASTLISRSKRKVDISQHTKAIDMASKGKTTPEIAKELGVSTDTVTGYVERGEQFDVRRYSSGTPVEDLYVNYVQRVQGIKNQSNKELMTIERPKYSREAAKTYKKEVDSLNAKLNTALLNKPRERQAQILSNKLYYENVTSEMDKDDKKKLRQRSLSRARTTVGAKRSNVDITDKEWEAIQARAVSTSKLEQILDNTDLDRVKELATPRQIGMSDAMLSRARSMLNRDYTYAEVAQALGVSASTIRNAID